MIVIKFKSREDKINGYYLLALKGIVRGLRDDLFEINDFMLKYLDEEKNSIRNRERGCSE
ncbi:MAG: hypothetical protein M0Z70_10140 [Nitrospiraceae bacterium]|nr:hypothetical protein [Nitrospirota bacterium]MDA8339645.1 hypothetical protein [Nitrospiraceae bacterium]